jgi:hypothetical protein
MPVTFRGNNEMSDRASQRAHVFQAFTLKKDLDQHIESLTKWLAENSLADCAQPQADESAFERMAWHYGYLIALRDVRDLLAAA